MKQLTLLILFCFALFAEDEVTPMLKKYSKLPFDKRIDAYSRSFLGKPYLEHPLGEGPNGEYDTKPLYRFDGFDCTTYTETVIALSRSKTKQEFENNLKNIRYKDGFISFVTRNHFPCADWIPNNIQKNFIKDITKEVAGDLGVDMAEAVVSKRNWYQFLDQKVKNLGSKFEDQQVSLPYLALAKLIARKEVPDDEKLRRKQEEEKYEADNKEKDPKVLHKEIVDLRLKYLLQDCEVNQAVLERIPSGSILNIIRPHYKVQGSELLVTHQGFVIHKKDGVYFRHVSYTGGEHAKDVKLSNYLILSLLMPSIKGIHLLTVIPN